MAAPGYRDCSMARPSDPKRLKAGRLGRVRKEPEMKHYWAEFYGRERTDEFLREAAEARLAAAARGRSVRKTPSAGRTSPTILWRLLHILRRAIP
jgi:hypothetical protein